MPARRAILLALALAAPAAAAQEPVQPPARPEPVATPDLGPLDLGAPAGAELTARTDHPFDRYALPVGPYGPDGAQARTLEGRVVRSAWRLADPQATTAAVMAAYRERLAQLGYEPLLACATDACGGFDFRFAVELLPPPAMLLDAADFAQLSARREAEVGEVFASVLVSRLLGAVYVQTVAVAPAVPAQSIVPAPGGMALALSGDAATLLARLTEAGHLRLDGVTFAPGSAEIEAGSAPALDRAAALLAARSDLAVLIVGHSDNQGPLADNIALSQRRAEAVRQALIARGIDGARLEAHGAGFLAPLASNATEEGRAQNRRVELVVR
jgi:OOP family OmpA-OmpF porin